MNDSLKEIIADSQTEKLFLGVKRHLDYELIPGKAFVCVGVRRGGKSTLLNQIMDGLMKKGVDRSDILTLNFFDDRLHELRNGHLNPILDAFYSLYPEKKGEKKIFCFFDEIQEVKKWEPFVDRLLRQEKWVVFLTGSSAKLLSTEISTQMRGRSLAWELFPFSFREFLDFCDVSYKRPTSKTRYAIQKAFDEYWIKGGFPEVFSVSDRTRRMVHQDYFKTIVYRDVIERYDVSHPQAVLQLGYRLLADAASLYSLNRLTDFSRSQGFKVDKGFVAHCVQWFEDAYFLFSVKMFSPSINKQNVNPRKIYAVDHALISSVIPAFSANAGHRLENLVFLHLRRRSQQIYYYKTKRGGEVDFVWLDTSGQKHLVQVCASLKNRDTREREMKALELAMEELNLNRGIIVTLQEEDIIHDRKRIDVVPAWKFLLG